MESHLLADCPTLACVEVLLVESTPYCPTLDVTKFPSARVLTASFQYLGEREFQTIPWLGQLVALPQLTRVAIDWGGINPGRFLIQLPAGCELEIERWCGELLSESLPHSASLAHLVILKIVAYAVIDFSCLATCPKLRQVELNVINVDNVLDRANLSTLNHVPDRCSVALIIRRDDAMRIASFKLPAGWSVDDVTPGSSLCWSQIKLIFLRIGSHNCTVHVNP